MRAPTTRRARPPPSRRFSPPCPRDRARGSTRSPERKDTCNPVTGLPPVTDVCASNAASSPENAAIIARPREPALPMIAKLLLQNLIWIVAMGAMLFVTAGTLHWAAAWVFLSTIAIVGIAVGLWLAKTDPALLAERLHPMMPGRRPAADKE